MSGMVMCVECEAEFHESDAEVYIETHGFEQGPFEEFSGCPNCGGNFEDICEFEEGDEYESDLG